MPNWDYFNAFIKRPLTFKNKKERILFITAGIIMVIAGLWLVWEVLHWNHTLPAKNPPSQISDVFIPAVLHWEPEILDWAETWDLDPMLVATVMQIESCGDPDAVSGAGAQGLFQVMPYHFGENENMLDYQTNAARGLAYLSQSYEKSNGNITLTLAGYNGGHGQITRPQDLWPNETQRYAAWGIGIYQEAKSGSSKSPTLEAWLRAGGASLCRQAERRLGLD